MSTIGQIIEHVKQIEINPDKIFMVVQYLRRYGYLKADFSIGDFLAGVRKFHEFMSLDEEEELTPESITLMERPRCGLPDIQPIQVEEVKWRKNNLTYCVNAYVGNLAREKQDEILDWIFNDIPNITNLRYTRVKGPVADVMISTGRGRGENFDGRGGTLAWAYLPDQNNSPLHTKFDLDENWTDSLYRAVAYHEILHTTNCVHSNVPRSLMNPYVSDIKVPQADDKRQLQNMYGRPIIVPTPTPTPVPTPTEKSLVLKLKGNFDVEELFVDGFRIFKSE